jgi:hypothetical protein
MYRWLLTWTFLLLWSLSSPDVFAQSGLLLGLHYDAPISKPLPYYAGSADSLSRSSYQTLMIIEEQGSYALRPAMDGLLIPRNNRFWRVGTKRSIYNNWVEDFIWAAPNGSRARLAGIQTYNGEYCEGHRTQSILYAGSDFLSLEQRSSGYCEGGVHPWFFNTLAVVPIDSTTHIGLTIDEVLNRTARTTLNQSVTTFLDNLDDDEAVAYMPEADPANWGLVRREGRWWAIGRVENLEEVGDKHHTDLPLNVALPTTLSGRGRPISNWRQIKAFAPDAVDAFAAPEQNWLVILHPRRLTIHSFIEGTIGPAALTHQLRPGTRAVMARWATGSRLRSWTQQFDRLAESSGS